MNDPLHLSAADGNNDQRSHRKRRRRRRPGGACDGRIDSRSSSCRYSTCPSSPRPRLALALALILLNGKTNIELVDGVEAAADSADEKSLRVSDDEHISSSSVKDDEVHVSPPSDSSDQQRNDKNNKKELIRPPHFPHASLIAHGHPADPHANHLHAISYPHLHDHLHHHHHYTHHHDWFHARIEDVEPTRLHGGFTYTDAHVPTPLTHGHCKHTEYVGDDDKEGEDDNDDEATAINEAVHHYYSVPGIPSAASFPDFDHFQHSIEERMQIDQEVQKTIEYNIDHPDTGSMKVEDLSAIIQTLKDHYHLEHANDEAEADDDDGKTKDGKQQEANEKQDIQQQQGQHVASPESQQTTSWWEILGIKQLLVDASITALSSNMMAMHGSCKDEVVASAAAPDSSIRAASRPVEEQKQQDNDNKPTTTMGYVAGEAEFRRKEDNNNKNGDDNNAGSDKSVEQAVDDGAKPDGGFKLSMRELIKAARSSTGVAGMASDASVAAAAMAAAAVQIEKEVHHDEGGDVPSLLELPSSQNLKEGDTRGGGDKWKRSEQFVVKRDQDGQQRRSDRKREGSSYSEGMDFPELDPFAIESSRLLSASFALVSNSFGLLADTVRILGDTAAAASGASVKIVGTTVRSVSTGLEGAGKRIELGKAAAREEVSNEKDKTIPKKRKALTSEKLLAGQKGGVKGLLHRDAGEDKDNVMGGTRRVLGKSVRLLASVGRGVGDSLVFAGTATESLASSTAGVAEETVRLFEEFAGSLSTAFEFHVKEKARPKEEAPTTPNDYSPWHDQMQRPSIVSFGRYESEESEQKAAPDDIEAEDATESDESIIESTQHLFKLVVSESIAFVDFALADTEDVPSFVPELLGVLLLCYVSSIILMSTKAQASKQPPQAQEKIEEPKVSPEGRESHIHTDIIVPPIPTHVIRRHRHHRASYCIGAGILMATDGGEHEDTLDSDSLTAEELDPVRQERAPDTKASAVKVTIPPPSAPKDTRRLHVKVWHILRAVVAEPFKITFLLIRFWFRFFFDRRMILLGIYGVAGLYLCRASQLRSHDIARNAEANGFRSAVSSAGSTSPSIRESAVWVNALLDEMWRVSRDDETTHPSHQAEYPDFIARAMKHALRKKSCRKATGRSKNGNSVLCTDKKQYGGLEPYISSILGESAIEVLEETSASRPSDITYISLHSFTLGSVPPIIRGMKLKGINDEDNTVNLAVDLDVLLGDSSIVLDIKLSTLDYALLPSTQVAIHSFDMRLPLDVTVEMMDQFPFVKGVKVSLSEVPPCRVRVTPLSENSGLRGVDLGSLPVLNDWIQEALHASLEEYLTPSYVHFDLKSLWYPDASAVPEGFVHSSHSEAKADAEELENTIRSALPSLTLSASEKATATLHGPLQMSTARNVMEETIEKRKVKHGDGKKTTPDSTDKTMRKNRYASSFNAIASQIADANAGNEETSLKGFEAAVNDGQCTVQ